MERTTEAIRAFFADEQRRPLLNRFGIEKAAGLPPRRLTSLERYPSTELTEQEIDRLVEVLERLQFPPTPPHET
ncbi:hypothetical protein [Persicitalea jodogahamensis]|uniref:hypothetical protein n=1 Tax=Persicitalea jodogahamensis TaxID=402147 RepID=UPI00167B8D4F|nr:hypothetical protein [Persicitalea jodogahamensis]